MEMCSLVMGLHHIVGNPGMISFLDRCLFRLYKIASKLETFGHIRNWWFSRKPPVLQNFQKGLQLSLRLM